MSYIPSEAQINLIESLQSAFEGLKAEKSQLLQKKVNVQYSCGRGSIIDNLKLVRHYICECGGSTRATQHTTSIDNSGSALDTYHLNCKLCGNEEKISFIMMKRALVDSNSKIPTKNRNRLYPYI